MVFVLAAIGGPRAIAAEGDLSGFDVPTLGSLPHGVARGSDGAIWFTERLAGVIGRLEGSVFTEHALPQPGSEPTAITPGPDGALWFVEASTGLIGRLTTGGVLDEFPTSSDLSSPAGIVAGPDGAMWFTERSTSRIGRITLDGQVMGWPTLTAGAAPTAITVGPDGAMWFVERQVAKLGRVATDGSRSEFALPAGSLPSGIAAGPDGALWVTLRGRDSIARVTTAGVLDAEFPLPGSGAGVSHIAAGPQGALWFTETSANKVGRITVDGTITEYPLAPGAGPQGIVEGTDGAAWFAEAGANRIVRLDPGVVGPVDETAPLIEIRSPENGRLLVLGEPAAADYSCADEPGGSGLASCDGPVASGEPVPAGGLGTHTFSVRATDVAGNDASESTSYLVFRWIDGTLLAPEPRPGAWLTLSLGMDLVRRGTDPLASATTRVVSCVDGSAQGSQETAKVHRRVGDDGSLAIRWNTDRAWANSCRTLTLAFSGEDWEGVTATFFVSWGSADHTRNR